MASLFEEAAALAWTVRRKSLETFMMPSAILDGEPGTLVARDGSLVSLVEIEGSRSLMGTAELERFVEFASRLWNGWLGRPGHALHIVFERAPGRAPVDRAIGRQERAARELGLDLGDVLAERARHLGRLVTDETVVAACWTRPSVLSHDEAKRDRQRFRKLVKQWPAGSGETQCPFAPYRSMVPRHEAMLASFTSACADAGLAVVTASGATAAAIIRGLVNGREAVSPDWRPVTASSDSMPRATIPPADGGLAPPLAPQLLIAEPDLDGGDLVIGERRYAALDMILGPRVVRPFRELVARIADAGLPVRFSLLIEGGGLDSPGAAMARLASSFTAFSSDDSRAVRNALKGLAAIRAEGRAVVRLRLTVLTWTARSADPGDLARRRGGLQQILEGWGELVATPLVGDLLEAFAGTVPGFACGGTAEPALAPLGDALRLLPVSRPAALSRSRASHLFRSPDGRMLPFSFEEGGDYGFDLIYGIPGRGKSVLMNSLALAWTLQGGQEALPMNAVIDIGPSSSGLVSLIRDALPPERRHEAGWFRLSMTPQSAINPFDTQLGCRRPLAAERAFLVNLLGLMLTPAGATGVPDGMREIVAPVIAETYRLRDDRIAGAEPHPFTAGRDVEVDAALRRLSPRISPEPVWWEVVDVLFDGGETAAAMRAQRYAVPVMTDLVSAVRQPSIHGLIANATLGATGESVTSAFTRILTGLAETWPIFFHPTAFDIGDVRIAAIDLAEVAPSGSDEADRQTAAVYLLARHALTRHWWITGEPAASFTPRVRAWHARRLREIRETPKRLCFDEFHRVSGAPAVLAQVERDVRETRKLRVTMTLASQRVEDFPPALVELASRIWVLGAGGKRSEIETLASIFSLSATLEDAVRFSLTGPDASGSPALLIAADAGGRLEQLVVNSPGPLELWALTTSPVDAGLRERVAAKLGPREARLRLARAFPGGSARHRIMNEIANCTESGEPASERVILDRLAAEITSD